jgi:hypothetical protein
MAESKFSGLSAAIKEAQQTPADVQRTEPPTRAVRAADTGKGRAPGKRSDPAWRQHTVMLKRETHLEATDILRRQDSGQDISELLQDLLEQWVNRKRSKT